MGEQQCRLEDAVIAALGVNAARELCDRVFVEQATGARAERPQLAQVLDHLRSGDTLVVSRLDRLARSLRDRMDVVTALDAGRRLP